MGWISNIAKAIEAGKLAAQKEHAGRQETAQDIADRMSYAAKMQKEADQLTQEANNCLQRGDTKGWQERQKWIERAQMQADVNRNPRY